MQISRRLFALVASSAIAPTIARAEAPGDTLDGLWQGTLTPLTGPELALAASDWEPFRIAIASNAVQIFLRNGDATTFGEIKPGAFRISRLAKSAVVHAIDASPNVPVGESWVESWTFSITMKTRDALSCAFTRQVKNHQAQTSDPDAFFTMILTGELQRIELSHV